MSAPRIALALAVFALIACQLHAAEPAAKAKPPLVREIFVPFEDLEALLENQPQRVLLPRKDYEDLLRKADKTLDAPAPERAALLSAHYSVHLEKDRARFSAMIVVDVLAKGLHALPLDLSGIGLRQAVLDDKPAPIGRDGNGRFVLFVEGLGRKQLQLEMVAPLQTTAATQVLDFRLPLPPATQFSIEAPGDVEVKSGADVVSRAVDRTAGVTRFELLLRRGDTSLVMSLNSRLQRQQRAVAARSVLVDEITEAYEQLHATVSFEVLHRAVEDFRFVLPDGFEVLEVRSPLLSRWALETEGERRLLIARLREPTVEPVVLGIVAQRSPPKLGEWTIPRLEPLDVVSHVAVVGLVVEQRLKTESVAAEGLIPIDTSVLTQAIPASVLRQSPGAPPVSAVVAYYAPQPSFELSARFAKPPAKLSAVTNILLVVEDRGLKVRGGALLTSDVEKLFGFDLAVPAGWHVTRVTAADEKPLDFQPGGPPDQPDRVRIRLPQAAAAGDGYRVYFEAEHTPAGWLDSWKERSLDFPAFAVVGAADDVGALAVDVRDDLTVRPEKLDRLTPLDDAEKDRYGLAGVETDLVYRYDGRPCQATLALNRTLPRLTARTWSFLHIEPDALTNRYEIAYDIQDARTDRLTFLLPETTPEMLTVRGLDELPLKEQINRGSEGGRRRWEVLLAEPRRGTVRIAVDFTQPLSQQKTTSLSQNRRGLAHFAESSEQNVPVPFSPGGFGIGPGKLALPIVLAGQVAYQSGFVAVEGTAELEVEITAAEPARRVDIGELVDAEYQPQRRLLGVFGFVGDPPPIAANVSRPPGYGLDTAIVQNAEISTQLSAEGISQTAARFQLRSKALYLVVRLPRESTLWSADLDDVPIKPHREGDNLLIGLPAATADLLRTLRIVYQTPVSKVSLDGKVDLAGPQLLLRADRDTPAVDVPVADLVWRVTPPAGYRVFPSGGTLSIEAAPPEPAAIRLLRAVVQRALWSPGPGYWISSAPLGVQLTDSYPYGGTEFRISREIAPPGIAEPHAYLPQPDSAPTSQPMPGMEGMGGMGGMMGRPGSGRPGMEGGMPGMPGAESESLLVDELNAGRQADLENTRMDPFRAPEEAKEAEHAARGRRRIAGEQAGQMGMGAPMPAGEPAQTPALINKPAAPPAPAQPAPQMPAKPPSPQDRLSGVRSLKIDLEQPSTETTTVAFRSLGAEPRLTLALANHPRFETAAWVLALLVFLVGFALTDRSASAKAFWMLFVVLVGTVIPLLPGLESVAAPADSAVYAAACLVPFYLLIAMIRLLGRLLSRWRSKTVATTTAAAALAGLLIVAPADAAPPKPAEDGDADRVVVQVVKPPQPVQVPDDAILIPYDPQSQTGVPSADKMLVPYAKYVELWNLAFPDERFQAAKPPAQYALAGASYSATLSGEQHLLLEGQLQVDVFVDEPVTIPLSLQGAVLIKAELDGQPARLSVVQPAPAPPNQQAPQQQAMPSEKQTGPPPPHPLLALRVADKGRRTLKLSIRIKLDRRGGWRVAEAVLPSAPATALGLTIPQPETEVRLSHVTDRQSYETVKADERIETTVGPGGALHIQWRPKVAEGQVDRSLTAQSTATLDVQEDGLRLQWQIAFEFPRTQREQFRLRIPGGYLLESVAGGNVRGWEVRQDEGHQTVDVSLLKAARDSEALQLRLARFAPVATPQFGEIEMPLVAVPDAALHSGRVTIRRSPLLELRTVAATGVTRTDLGPEPAGPAADGLEESPLGLRAYEAYRFASVPFTVKLAVSPVKRKVTAEVETVLRISEYQRSLESRVRLRAEGRPLHRAEIFLPANLKLDHVSAPGEFHWAITRRDDRPLLSLYLADGVQGQTPLLIRGTIPPSDDSMSLALPRIEVVGADRQEGDIAVQVDPAFDVSPVDLKNVEAVLLKQLFGWLTAEQRRATRLALHHRGADYGGRLQLTARQPLVRCETITNVRVTDRAVEETVLLDFTIQRAGVREVSFLLPESMKAARIQVPMLRQKTIEPAGGPLTATVRVRLELQDEMMGGLRVLVENDRILTADAQQAPIPTVETGQTDRRFVVLESAGRDEVMVKGMEGFDPLSRQQQDWQRLVRLLGTGITEAYLAGGQKEPRLTFAVQPRKAWEAAGARIGLSETDLVLDAGGAYRARLVYRLDNTTQQYLQIRMPPGSRLWTAQVAGEPVKPTKALESNDPHQIRIPLVKTAAGDLDYQVVLKYGGRMDPLQPLAPARRPVQFPLVRTVNIPVAESQVRLHLPPTHRWFDFGGTMGPPVDAADLAAGYVAYQTKVTQRLVETMQSADDFAKVRAAANFGDFQQQVEQSQSLLARDASNEPLQRKLAENTKKLEQARQQVQEVEEIAGKQVIVDNRAKMNALFADQDLSRARNAFSEMDRNWDFSALERGETATDTKAPEFNAAWLRQNRLADESDVKKADKAASDRPQEKKSGPSRLLKGKSAQMKPQPDSSSLGRGIRLGIVADEKAKGQPQDQITNGVKERSAGAVARYQQSLKQQMAPQPSADFRSRVELQGQQLGGLAFSRDGAIAARQEERLSEMIPHSASLPAATGLASLDVDLPMRGAVYHFTTPQGDIEITARAVSRTLVQRLGWATVVVMVVLLVIAVAAAARRGRFDWFATWTGCLLLIVAGAISVVLGIAPLLGVIAFAAGGTLAVRRALLPGKAKKP